MGHQGKPEAMWEAGHLSPDWFDPGTHQLSLSVCGLKKKVFLRLQAGTLWYVQ